MGSVDSVSRLPIISNVRLESNLSTTKSPEESLNILEQQPESQSEKDIKEKDLDNVIKDMNTVLEDTHTSLKYVYHEKLEKYYVTLIDDETKETVKEIPPKKLLDIYASMKEYLGLFLDNKI